MGKPRGWFPGMVPASYLGYNTVMNILLLRVSHKFIIYLIWFSKAEFHVAQAGLKHAIN